MMNRDKNFEKPDQPESGLSGPGPNDLGSNDLGSNDSSPKEDATELMLVAYLDDEMEQDERREFETRLESTPALRRRLKQLRQAWDLLDELEACAPSRRFAETTLEMVALDAETYLKDEKAKRRRALRQRRNWIGLGLFISLAAGFALIWLLYPSPDAMLIKNLPLIAKLDQYEAAESVAFLEALVEAKLFLAPTTISDATSRDSVPGKKASLTSNQKPPLVSNQKPPFASDQKTSLAPDGPSLEQTPDPIPGSAKLRREWVEHLEPVQKAQLLQYWERFEQLPPEQRRKLLDLQNQLAESKRSALLTTVMRRYSKWLRRQPSFTRTGLLDLSALDRIAKLRSLRREELDRQGLKRWLQANQAKLGARFKEMMRSPDGMRELQRGRFPAPGMRPGGRGPRPGMGPGGRWSIDGHRPQLLLKLLPDEDLVDLKRDLSSETAKEWDTKSPNWQRLQVGQMIHQMMWEKGIERRISARANRVSDEELADFFERLPPTQQTKLLSTPGEQLHQNLIDLYPKDPSRRGRGFGRGPGPDPKGKRRSRDSERSGSKGR